ncbi:MAG: hypothetical protein R2726_17190 [Acidimicrobiales bacterium]
MRFSLDVSGNAGDVVKDVVTANVVDNDQTPATGSDDAQVTVTDVPPTIVVTKSADGLGGRAGGSVASGGEEHQLRAVTIALTDSGTAGPFSIAPATRR